MNRPLRMNDPSTHRSDSLPKAGLPASLRSRIALRIASSRDPLARLLAGGALELYYEVGDAHSQLCAALARRLLPRLKIDLVIRLVPAPDARTYPEETRQREFALLDAQRIAPCHGLPPPQPVAADQREAMEAQLARADSAAAFLDIEQRCLQQLAQQQTLTPPRVEAIAHSKALLHRHAKRRTRLGHYLPAMWQYRGEWFWALDRLEFLHQRLIADRALLSEVALSHIDASRLPLPPPAGQAPLEFWFSFRSPYSYLAAVELLRRGQASTRALQVRPVLPMVMRGLPVPRIKRLYIVRDVKRSADALGTPFGHIHDPVGEGVRRLLTVYPYDADSATQLRYCAIAAQTVWAEGLDVCRDDVLHSVLERCGLDWASAAHKLAAGTDTQRAEQDRDALFAAGLWGVPSFRIGDFATWGQDRLWMIDRL
ncbi:MAG TPA: DsbA family protein [Fontimonas sp.]